MAVIDTLIVFAVSLLIGALGIYVGARVITNTEDFTYALITALIGAAVWVLVAFLIGWIPLLGPLVALIAYIAVINYRYPGGWLNAIAIALIAWLASLIVIAILAALGVTTFDAAGVPGV
ncbi:hypothetical protein [Halorientalis halophila]|uniref:hypothetical protein n=1 Tax=Halorientalis halophila TaxID=3108499 RepID=UPI003008F936